MIVHRLAPALRRLPAATAGAAVSVLAGGWALAQLGASEPVLFGFAGMLIAAALVASARPLLRGGRAAAPGERPHALAPTSVAASLVETRVRAALGEHPELPDTVAVTVHDHTVHLFGFVHSDRQATLAIALAEHDRLPVMSHLEVVPPVDPAHTSELEFPDADAPVASSDVARPSLRPTVKGSDIWFDWPAKGRGEEDDPRDDGDPGDDGPGRRRRRRQRRQRRQR